MVITKDALSAKLAEEIEYNNKFGKEIIDSLCQIILDELGKGNEIQIRGFGKFFIKMQAPRTARVVKTGEPVHVPATPKMKFKAYAEFDVEEE